MADLDIVHDICRDNECQRCGQWLWQLYQAQSTERKWSAHLRRLCLRARCCRTYYQAYAARERTPCGQIVDELRLYLPCIGLQQTQRVARRSPGDYAVVTRHGERASDAALAAVTRLDDEQQGCDHSVRDVFGSLRFSPRYERRGTCNGLVTPRIAPRAAPYSRICALGCGEVMTGWESRIAPAK